MAADFLRYSSRLRPPVEGWLWNSTCLFLFKWRMGGSDIEAMGWGQLTHGHFMVIGSGSRHLLTEEPFRHFCRHHIC